MIHFGQKKSNLGPSWKNVEHLVIQGYYLVCRDKYGEENRHWFSISHDIHAFEQITEKYLGGFNQWEFWIDYCYGYDVNGNLAWANMDQTDRFI